MKTISREEFEKRNVFGTGAENTGFAQYFIGNSYLNPLTDPKNCAVFMANVTFEPGCRTRKRRNAISYSGSLQFWY